MQTDHDPHLTTPSGKPRARAIGISFDGTPGPWNAITDVPGLEVGYSTLIEGDSVRTGVTAIHPRGRDDPADPCAAGFHSLNGNGEMTGLSWIGESGTMAGPIAITNTHAVGIAHSAVVQWTVKHHPAVAEGWLLPVAAETWDGYLNDINGGHVTESVATAAIESAAPGPIEEGSVGGGTGMMCYQYKGGSGTASRLVTRGQTTYTVGGFLQSNFGALRELWGRGTSMGERFTVDDPVENHSNTPAGAGSVIVIVATDAPLLPNQCEALARRVALGLARTGTSGSHFSGDLFLALSTGNPGGFTPSRMVSDDPSQLDRIRFVPWRAMDPFYAAVVAATEEAVLNSLVANEDMVGLKGRRVPAFPREEARRLFQ